eukprot:6530391-Karenia_brevis.AAC.1
MFMVFALYPHPLQCAMPVLCPLRKGCWRRAFHLHYNKHDTCDDSPIHSHHDAIPNPKPGHHTHDLCPNLETCSQTAPPTVVAVPDENSGNCGRLQQHASLDRTGHAQQVCSKRPTTSRERS